jgi:hypothetical protein
MRTIGHIPPPGRQSWRGRSGRLYAVTPLSLADFMLEPGALYLIAKGPNALWVGSAEDIIADQQSRARFRLALGCADRAFRVETGGNEDERLASIWDLETAAPELDVAA